MSSLAATNLSIIPTYVPSAANKADYLSCGIMGAEELHIEPHIIAPK